MLTKLVFYHRLYVSVDQAKERERQKKVSQQRPVEQTNEQKKTEEKNIEGNTSNRR